MEKIIENKVENKTPGYIDGLLEDFEKKEPAMGEKLIFEGVDGRDVYNTTAPFEYKGKTYIIGRVESPDIDTDTESIFFEEKEGKWRPVKDILSLKMQDPFVTQIDGELIVGGVRLYPKTLIETPELKLHSTPSLVAPETKIQSMPDLVAPETKIQSMPDLVVPEGMGHLTSFYRGPNPAELKKFTEGPEGMKDIRLIKLPNGKIGVFTRPGDIYTRTKDGIGGLIGYIEIDSLNDLTEENINKAEIIEGLFGKEEWGGANELFLLESGKIGVLGHIARHNEKGEKEYYAMTFEFDPQAEEGINKVSNKKIIATRKNFPEGEPKRMEYKNKKSDDYLANIVFSGGMTVDEDNTTTLYAGLSDSEQGKIIIDYPFLSPVKKALPSK